MTVEEKIRYSDAKLRNIIYYRLEVEPKLEDRYRCQLIGVLRSYRKQVLDIIKELNKTDPRRDYYIGISKIINPKVKSDECYSTIIKLKNFVDEKRK